MTRWWRENSDRPSMASLVSGAHVTVLTPSGSPCDLTSLSRLLAGHLSAFPVPCRVFRLTHPKRRNGRRPPPPACCEWILVSVTISTTTGFFFKSYVIYGISNNDCHTISGMSFIVLQRLDNPLWSDHHSSVTLDFCASHELKTYQGSC